MQEWLQAGYSNTPAQWQVMSAMGYTRDEMCSSWGESHADNSTLLVWEADASDPEVTWATGENVIPYISRLYSVESSSIVVMAQVMKATPYAQFASDPSYASYMAQYKANYCSETHPNPAVMRDAMTTDPTGVKFRAALEACFSFFTVYTGTGYSYDERVGGPGRCREYLYPTRDIQLLAPRNALLMTNGAIEESLQTLTESQQQQQPTALLRRDHNNNPDAATATRSVVPVMPLALSIGKDFTNGQDCSPLPSPTLLS